MILHNSNDHSQSDPLSADRSAPLRMAVAHAPIVLFAVDHTGHFTLSEGQGLDLLGIRPGQHVGQSYFDLYAHLPESIAEMRRALAGEQATTIDHYQGIVFETRWTPIRAPDGTVTGVVGVCADVTARFRHEEQQERLKRQTAETLDALLAMARTLVDDTVPLLPGDPGGPAGAIVTRLADLIRQLLGCQRVSVTAVDQDTGRQRPLALVGVTSDLRDLWQTTILATNFYAPDADPCLVARLVAGEIVFLDYSQPPLSEQRNPFGISSALVAPMQVHNRLVGLMALDHSRTIHAYTPEEVALAAGVSALGAIVIERERLLHEREEAQTNEVVLREANRRMDEFLSIAGHEMRTPLTVIMGGIEVTLRRLHRLTQLSSPQAPLNMEWITGMHSMLNQVLRQAERLQRLIDDLLDVSRIQAGHLDIRRVRCDLGEIVRDAVQTQVQLAAPRTILFPDLPPQALLIDGDADRLTQVVTNYLTNALKYSPVDQPITVGITRQQDVARVWVQDHGAGVAPAEHARIWERFYRIDNTGHPNGSSVGLGMGLHISRTIIERQGGQVGLVSAPGQGATFWFTLPLCSPS